MTCSTGIGRSSAVSVNDGTQRSVTAVTTPSAPSPTRAAANSSGRSDAEQVTSEPSARTRPSASTWVASPPSRAPVPCVPVDRAPAIVWASISPRLARASPNSAAAAFRPRSVVPDRAVTRPVWVSAAVIPVHRDRSRARPLVAAAEVNECPLPSARTRSPAAAASLTAAEISASVRGWSHRAGVAVAVPAQFRHWPGPAGCLITREYLLCEHVRRSRPEAHHTHSAGGRHLAGRSPARAVRPCDRGPRPAAGPGRPGRVRQEHRRPDPPGRGPSDPGGHQVAAVPVPDRTRPDPAGLPGPDVLLPARSPLALRRGHQRRPAGRLPYRGPEGAAGPGRGRGGQAARHDHGRLCRAPGCGRPGPGRRPRRDPGLPRTRRLLAAAGRAAARPYRDPPFSAVHAAAGGRRRTGRHPAAGLSPGGPDGL